MGRRGGSKGGKGATSAGAGSGVSLGQQLAADNALRQTRNKKRPQKREHDEFIDAGLTKKILLAAREQQQEDDDDSQVVPTIEQSSLLRLRPSDSESDGEADYPDVDDDRDFEPDNYYENIEVDEDDERALEMFMSSNPQKTRNLADIIMDKINEKQTELKTQFSEAGEMQLQEIDPRVRGLYEGVRDVLKRYRSGKLPKAFKMIPNLRNWEQLLHITEPTSWSAASMYQATRIFASNLKEKMAQRFYNLVLLPRIRDDIAEYKKINFHIYQAIKKSLYKPGAFMKGILLPLLESGNCTLREAIIVGSVLARNSVPILHSCAALLKVAEMPYTGANSIIIRIFLDKKYALPYRVVDATVFHFLRFERDNRMLPVLWHQALLTFAQRYKADISIEQREALLILLRKQSHPTITAEIRRELQSAKCRDVEIPNAAAMAID
ncbi:bystin [Arctopsyche grandis]|uniref:bystin n=1 Tax=Arctopsyche grandis TaxID=121162 RepID=UPI00406D8AAE